MADPVALAQAELDASNERKRLRADRKAFGVLFASRMLADAKEPAVPEPLNFANPLVVRTPQLWLLIFERRDVSAGLFETEDENEGLLTQDFAKAIARCFAGTEDAPFVLPADQTEDSAALTRVFMAIGSLYCVVPMNPSLGHAENITALLKTCRPLTEEAYRIIRRMNSRNIALNGGSADRYLTQRLLDPSQFGSRDKKAVERATTRAEVPLESALKKVRLEAAGTAEVCGICKRASRATTRASWVRGRSTGSPGRENYTQ